MGARVLCVLVRERKTRISWAMWPDSLTHGDAWRTKFATSVYSDRRNPMRWTRSIRQSLEERIEMTAKRLGLDDGVSAIADAFIAKDFIGGYDALMRERTLHRKSR